MEPRKYEYIDSLRGLAILLVLMLHCGQAGSESAWFPSFANRFIESGQYGVQLFFLVSAYTLMLSYHSRRDEPQATRNFFIRRFLRIAPLYYLAIAYYSLQNFIGFNYLQTGTVQETLSMKEVAANILFINNLRPGWINHLVPGGWSVTIEFTFYFFLPIICSRIRSINDSIIFVLVALMLSSVLKLHHMLGGTVLNSHNFLYWYFPNQLCVFALGIFSYFVIRGNNTIKSSSLLLLACTIFFYCYFPLPEHFAYSLAFGLLLIVLSKQHYSLFVNKTISFIGRISFSIYIVHFAIIHWLRSFKLLDYIRVTNWRAGLINYGVRYVVILSVSCLICHFTYKYIEAPFISLGRRITSNAGTGKKINAPLPAMAPLVAEPANAEAPL